MRYTVNLDCKTHHVSRDGTIPVLLRVSINGVHDYFNIGKKIKAEHYDKENRSIRSGITGHSVICSFIDRQKVKINNIICDFEKKGEVATIAKVKDIYEKETGKVKSDSFYEYVEDTIKWESKKYILKSDNTTYEPYEINKDDILSMWLVRDYKITSLFPRNPYTFNENIKKKA
ncbi:MAG: hypothetical protein HY840_07565 [Bacteroidetes bacterium]|nr:hypothetical protein [Bacteroidota bacterium]